MTKTETRITVERDHEPMMKIEEVANLLNMSVPSIRRAIKRGEIPYRKICGTSIRFIRREIEQWINRSR